MDKSKQAREEGHRAALAGKGSGVDRLQVAGTAQSLQDAAHSLGFAEIQRDGARSIGMDLPMTSIAALRWLHEVQEPSTMQPSLNLTSLITRVVLGGLSVGLAGGVAAQTTNIAPLGVASQQSNYDSISEAWRAVDGFTSPIWTFSSANRLSSTNGSAGAWWQLDLPRPFEITEVVLFNRDPYGDRLGNFRVSLSDASGEVFGQDYFVGAGHVPNGGTAQLLAPAGTFATRVRVEFINGLNNQNNGFLTLAEVQVFSPTIGSTYCGPANPNVSGVPATITAVGTDLLASPYVTAIVAHGLPEQTFGYFLVGAGAGSVTPPGSNGVLCLGGAIGRYSLLIHNTTRTENMGIVINRSALPVNPARAILPGETWRFQAWFRDGASSNFSDAVAVQFH